MSAATPITVRHSRSPFRIRLPTAFAALPQNRCANVLFTIATGAAFSSSRLSNARPATTSIFSVRK